MKTKDRIMEEALTLFSTKGFRGTSVKSIAQAVGIQDSSLYKHFKSKQEILDTIVKEMRLRMERMSHEIGLPGEGGFRQAADFYGKLTLKDLQELSKKTFLFYLTDPFAFRFWRLANMEQYQNPEIYDIFRHIFMEESISYQKQLFAAMIEKGIFYPGNPEVMALSFYAPIYFLLSKYSGRPEEVHEALDILDRQVEEFYRLYRATGEGRE